MRFDQFLDLNERYKASNQLDPNNNGMELLFFSCFKTLLDDILQLISKYKWVEKALKSDDKVKQHVNWRKGHSFGLTNVVRLVEVEIKQVLDTQQSSRRQRKGKLYRLVLRQEQVLLELSSEKRKIWISTRMTRFTTYSRLCTIDQVPGRRILFKLISLFQELIQSTVLFSPFLFLYVFQPAKNFVASLIS